MPLPIVRGRSTVVTPPPHAPHQPYRLRVHDRSAVETRGFKGLHLPITGHISRQEHTLAYRAVVTAVTPPEQDVRPRQAMVPNARENPSTVLGCDVSVHRVVLEQVVSQRRVALARKHRVFQWCGAWLDARHQRAVVATANLPRPRVPVPSHATVHRRPHRKRQPHVPRNQLGQRRRLVFPLR